MVEFLTSDALETRHGFFTRNGGVSSGDYASLNCSLSGGDDPVLVQQNRALVAGAMGLGIERLVGTKQVHGIEVAVVSEPWGYGLGPDADGMVTNRPGVALGVITADCDWGGSCRVAWRGGGGC